MERKSLEELYGLEREEVDLLQVDTPSGRWLELFMSPGNVLVNLEFPEFTCLCPKTSQLDFATLQVVYVPNKLCVEEKSLKYYMNSFRSTRHFHEEVLVIIEKDLRKVIEPLKLWVSGSFNTRGGIDTVVEAGDFEDKVK